MPSVNIAPYIKNQYFNASGVPLSGGLLNVYEAGTSTRKTTYSDAAGTVANANPIVLDSAGRLSLYLATGAHKFVLTDSVGNIQWTEDNVSISTVTTSVDTVADMVALVGGSASIIRTLGRTTKNDGGGWWYYWSATSIAADDGGMVLQPNSLPASGRWIGLMPSDRELNVRIYGAVCDNQTDDTAKIVACNAWCYTNKCAILVDTSIYCATDPSLTVKLKLLPGVIFRYGNFNPTLDVVIDANDKTQHFSCTETYYPVLNVNELYPEWFGETVSSYPVTTATIESLTGQKTKILRSVDIHTDTVIHANLGADMGAASRIKGRLTLDSAPTASIDIWNGGIGIIVGADGDADQRTNGANKYGSIAHPHYTNAELEIVSLSTVSTQTENVVAIGGLDEGSYNAATKISLRTCATATGGHATEKMSITSNGSVVVGTPTGGAKGAGTINAEAVYDDNVLLTGYVLDKKYNPDFKIEDWNTKARNGLEHKSAIEFVARSKLMLNLDDYCEFIKAKRMLPTFEDVETTGEIPSTGAMIQKLWEVVEIQSVHIKQLNDRLKKLETK